MTDLKQKIEAIYALDRERTRCNWLVLGGKYIQQDRTGAGGQSCPEEVAETTNMMKSSDDAAFIAAAPEMVDIIRSLEAKVVELTHFKDMSVGLWCVDRNPSEVTHEWIKENTFQLENK